MRAECPRISRTRTVRPLSRPIEIEINEGAVGFAARTRDYMSCIWSILRRAANPTWRLPRHQRNFKEKSFAGPSVT